MAVRKGKALASATEAKVSDTAAQVETAVEVTESTATELLPAEPAAVAVEAVSAAVEAVSVPAAAAEPVEVAALAVASRAGSVVEAGTAQTRATMEKTMDQATKAAEGLFKAAEEAAEFGRGNVEAVTKATQIYVAGVQDLGKQTLALVQGLTDHTVAGAKALGTVKSLKEVAEIQASYTRAALEKSMTETAKLQEAALKLAEASFAPISARMTLAVEKFSKPLAA